MQRLGSPVEERRLGKQTLWSLLLVDEFVGYADFLVRFAGFPCWVV